MEVTILNVLLIIVVFILFILVATLYILLYCKLIDNLDLCDLPAPVLFYDLDNPYYLSSHWLYFNNTEDKDIKKEKENDPID